MPTNLIVPFHKKITFEAAKRLIQRTPVDTGRARGGWITTVGAPSTQVGGEDDKQGDSTLKKSVAALSNLTPFQVIYITNNVEYIEVLENGHSKQAPRGMLKTTVHDLAQMFK
jgi:hypothetical protein